MFCLTTIPSFVAIAQLGACKRVFHFGNCVPSTWGGDKEVYEIDCIRVAARIPC